MAVSFADATTVKAIDSHTYTTDFESDWCIGSVPHGGYVASCFMRVASAHFATTLRAQNQPHTMTMHLEYPRRTEVGPAIFKVKDVKLGRQTSTIHITLTQHGREEVLAYINQANLDTLTGPTFPSGWKLEPERYPVDLAKLNAGTDEHWAEQGEMPFAPFRRASSRVRFFFPRKGQYLKSMNDQWIIFRDGERFTNESLGYVADMFPQVVESYVAGMDPYKVGAASQKSAAASFWYPTVVLNLDVKKALPKEGVEWLAVRTRSKQIQNGRLDIEVVIMDEKGDLIALSHHVALVVSAARNMAERRREGDVKL
ncbi:hypothetical protein EJ06DRAFT_28209 [Trichodelitschia bisporula]|uniref:Thioesterase family protein n=1 Tax=Trichodelitschia bisporula TaxID=703511 RepID=A0A6G1IBC8_9PEZI|nr:hypothetical protein EJ06DRAFT_28209 [Trichodelitschia bisporula]